MKQTLRDIVQNIFIDMIKNGFISYSYQVIFEDERVNVNIQQTSSEKYKVDVKSKTIDKSFVITFSILSI